MICPRCQNQLPDNSVACNICGLSFQMVPQPQKKSTKKLVIGLISCILGAILLAIIIPVIISYLPKEIDYGDAEAFEQALNKGENVQGKVVRFKVREYATPVAGYNLHAGDHLNFISFKNPGVSTGETITVKVTKVQDFDDGKFGIWYKKVKNGKVTSNTVTSD